MSAQPTTCAIYARRSNEQVGRSEEQKSVTRQKEVARAFALSKGWTVDDRYVFVDDGISGAEFGEKRPGFARLMAALKPRPPFQVLIVSEQKSIGREAFETGYVIKLLDEAGVEIVEYVHGRSLNPKNWTDKVTSAVMSSADEAHRQQSSERVHEAHTRLFQKGYCVGGRVFGYRNVHVYCGVDRDGNQLRSHTDRTIEPTESVVVRRIFDLYDSGLGLKAIAKVLTNEQAASPRPFKRQDGLLPIIGWSPCTVRTILTREIYRGVVVWNRSRKRTSWGKVDQRPRPESEWIRAERKDLQIVPDDLWARVAARREDIEGKAVRFASGRLSGRPPKHATKNLLAGLATCGVCGGGLVVETSARKHGRIPEYVCHRHRHNGTCRNALRVPVAEMNEAVLSAIEEHALTLEAVEQVIRLTERDDVRDRQTALGREQQDIENRLKRLTNAIETGGQVATLLERVRELEARLRALRSEVAGLQPVPRLDPVVIEDRLGEWRRLLRQSTTQGRAVLQRVLRGRLTFTPHSDGRGYDFSGPTRFDKLFTGIIAKPPAFMIPDGIAGTEGIRAADDADYGRLLEQALSGGIPGKGLASPTGFENLWRPEFKGRVYRGYARRGRRPKAETVVESPARIASHV